MRMTARSLGLIGVLGGLGGAVNAGLCFWGVPVATTYRSFQWHLIPAGAMHGAVLALMAVIACALVWGRPWFAQCLALPFIGWASGWVAWIPLQWSIVGESLGDALQWPLEGQPMELVLGLWQQFGLVSLIYCGSLWFVRRLTERAPWLHVPLACIAGATGSLWFWLESTPWHNSLLHGAIWGSLVGFGVWKSRLFPPTTKP